MKLFIIALIASSFVGCSTASKISKSTADTIADVACTAIHFGAGLVSTVSDGATNAVGTVVNVVK